MRGMNVLFAAPRRPEGGTVPCGRTQLLNRPHPGPLPSGRGKSQLALLLLLPVLAACGGDGGGNSDPTDTPIGTLAYVETTCRDTPQGFYEHQRLRVRQGDGEPVTVFATPGVGPIGGVGGLCRLATRTRWGDSSAREAVQTVAVSPDGSTVVFETSDDFSVLPPLPLNLAPEQKGMFVVRADGTGLRRLGPPSREPFSVVEPVTLFGVELCAPAFSPNGRTITFVDRGPDVAGNEASQVVTVDLETGSRTQLTHLPPGPPVYGHPGIPSVVCPAFLDSDTIAFGTTANVDGTNPTGDTRLARVRTNGSHLEVGRVPVALPGGVFTPTFIITGERPTPVTLFVPGEPVNDVAPTDTIGEVFLIDKDLLLQLTNFRREDTWVGTADRTRQHVFFSASANPMGTNPSENCQVFSIDRTGSDLRQLTDFVEGTNSRNGCLYDAPPGCTARVLAQDARTGTLVLHSNCDPFGTNPYGSQMFAMRPDGSGLRQLTDARGVVTEADGTLVGELVGHVAYGPYE